MIHLIRSRATKQQVDEMLEELEDSIKVVVDIRRGILAGGGELHSDCEEKLLDDGSRREDIWGAGWEPDLQQITYDSMINIRPGQNNFSRMITDPAIRDRVQEIIRQLLEGV
jgi:hypothetical protein